MGPDKLPRPGVTLASGYLDESVAYRWQINIGTCHDMDICARPANANAALACLAAVTDKSAPDLVERDAGLGAQK